MRENFKNKAVEIITNYIDGDHDPAVEQEVRRWLASDFHGSQKEAALWYLWETLPLEKDVDSERAYRSVLRQLNISRPRRSIPARIALRVAAVLLPAALIAGILWMTYNKKDTTLNQPPALFAETRITTGENTRSLTLPDGSKVWVNSRSEFSYGNERTTSLSGEAYFDVATAEGAEFRVTAKGIDITVLGTRFNVTAYEHSGIVTISLYEGNLRVDFAQRSLLLEEDQEIIIDLAAGTTAIGNTSRSIPEWMREVVNFTDLPTTDIFRHLEQMFGVEINTDNYTGGQDIMTLKFERATDLEDVLFFMSNINGKFSYTVAGPLIKINDE